MIYTKECFNIKKVNLGCGTNIVEGWINIDNSFNARLSKYPSLRYLLWKVGIFPNEYYNVPWKKVSKYIVIHDCKKKLPFEDSSIDFIYTSHLIEHLSLSDAEKLMKECFRVLKRRGTIRIVTPDLKILILDYIKNLQNSDKLYASEKFLNSSGLGLKNEESLFKAFLLSGHKHKWLYDEISLNNLLNCSGFKNVSKKKFQEGMVPDVSLLDNRSINSLYMEAQKL